MRVASHSRGLNARRASRFSCSASPIKLLEVRQIKQRAYTELRRDGSRCGPCRQVFPHLSRMQREFADRGLEVVGIR